MFKSLKIAACTALLAASAAQQPVLANSDKLCLGVANLAGAAQGYRQLGLDIQDVAANVGYTGTGTATDQLIADVLSWVYRSQPIAQAPEITRLEALVQCRRQYTPEDRT